MSVRRAQMFNEIIVSSLQETDEALVKHHVIDIYPVYTSTFNPERNRFRSHASVYTTPTNPHQRFQPD